MSRKKTMPWGRIFVEGTMIVVSILLAFGIQAWWEGRALQAARRAALASLSQDFEGYVQLIEHRRDANLEAVEAANQILERVGPNATLASETELRTALLRLAAFSPLDLRPGSFSAVLGSQERVLIENPELLDALGGWAQALERLARRNSFVEARSGSLHDYLVERYPLRDVMAGYLDGQSPFPASGEELMRSPAFENLVFLRGTASKLILEDIESLDQLGRLILDLLNTELDGLG